jgi:hypothetical protein
LQRRKEPGAKKRCSVDAIGVEGVHSIVHPP